MFPHVVQLTRMTATPFSRESARLGSREGNPHNDSYVAQLSFALHRLHMGPAMDLKCLVIAGS